MPGLDQQLVDRASGAVGSDGTEFLALGRDVRFALNEQVHEVNVVISIRCSDTTGMPADARYRVLFTTP